MVSRYAWMCFCMTRHSRKHMRHTCFVLKITKCTIYSRRNIHKFHTQERNFVVISPKANERENEMKTAATENKRDMRWNAIKCGQRIALQWMKYRLLIQFS